MKFVISTLFRFPLVFASESASEAAVKESWAAAVRKPKKVIPSETQTNRTSTKGLKRGIYFSSRIFFKFSFSSRINEEFRGISKKDYSSINFY